MTETPMTPQPQTPLPWHQGVRYPTRILANEGEKRCIVAATTLPADEERPNATELANARYIVHACNQYPQLVEALREVVVAFQDNFVPGAPYLAKERDAYEAAKAALTAAEGDA